MRSPHPRYGAASGEPGQNGTSDYNGLVPCGEPLAAWGGVWVLRGRYAAAVTAVTSAFAAGMIVGAPLMAVLSMRWPRRRALLVFLVAFGLVHVAGAITTSFSVLPDAGPEPVPAPDGSCAHCAARGCWSCCWRPRW